MYVLAVLCLLAAVAAMPASDNLKANLPELPPSELKVEDKNKDEDRSKEEKIPVLQPILDPIKVDLKDPKEADISNEIKEINKLKDSKESKEKSKESKESEEWNDSTKSKESEEWKDSKKSKESNESKESKESKNSKESKESKEDEKKDSKSKEVNKDKDADFTPRPSPEPGLDEFDEMDDPGFFRNIIESFINWLQSKWPPIKLPQIWRQRSGYSDEPHYIVQVAPDYEE